jgi:hypothetical protein
VNARSILGARSDEDPRAALLCQEPPGPKWWMKRPSEEHLAKIAEYQIPMDQPRERWFPLA